MKKIKRVRKKLRGALLDKMAMIIGGGKKADGIPAATAKNKRTNLPPAKNLELLRTDSVKRELKNATTAHERIEKELINEKKRVEALKRKADDDKKQLLLKEKNMEKKHRDQIAELTRKLKQAESAIAEIPAAPASASISSAPPGADKIDERALEDLNRKLDEAEERRKQVEAKAEKERIAFGAELAAAKAAAEKEKQEAQAAVADAKRQKEEAAAAVAHAEKQRAEAAALAAASKNASPRDGGDTTSAAASAEVSTIKAENEKLQQRLRQAEDDARQAMESAKRAAAVAAAATTKQSIDPSRTQKSGSKINALTWRRMRKEQNAIDLKVKGKKGVEEAMARIEDVAASIKAQLVARNPNDPQRPVTQFRKLLNVATEDDGRLDSDEFRETLKDMNILLPADDVRAALEYFDLQHDGRLVIAELFDIMDKLGKTRKRRGATQSPIVKNAWADVGEDDALGKLPPNWEKGVTADGKVYFIDHASEATTWDDPRLRSSAAGAGVAAVRSRRARRN
jgi:chromosome segregation ATPase